MNYLRNSLFLSNIHPIPIMATKAKRNGGVHEDFVNDFSSNSFIDYSISMKNKESVLEAGSGIVITETSFLKNVSTLSLSPSSSFSAKSRKSSRRHSLSSNSSLPSIPESDMIKNIPDDIHKVTIISMIDDLSHQPSSPTNSSPTSTKIKNPDEPEQSEYNNNNNNKVNNSELNSIGERLHQVITSNMNFTCMKNIPSILKSSYISMTNELRGQSSSKEVLPARYSITTVLISGRDVCIAHLGDSRSVIYGLDGNLLQLTQDHVNPNNSNEITRALGDKDGIPDTMYFQIQSDPNARHDSSSSEHSSDNEENDKSKSSSFSPKDIFSRLSTRKRSKSEGRSDNLSSSSHAPYLVIGNSQMWKSATNKQIAASIRKNVVDKNLSLDETSAKLIGFSHLSNQKAILIRWKNQNQ